LVAEVARLPLPSTRNFRYAAPATSATQRRRLPLRTLHPQPSQRWPLVRDALALDVLDLFLGDRESSRDFRACNENRRTRVLGLDDRQEDGLALFDGERFIRLLVRHALASRVSGNLVHDTNSRARARHRLRRLTRLGYPITRCSTSGIADSSSTRCPVTGWSKASRHAWRPSRPAGLVVAPYTASPATGQPRPAR